MRTDLHTVNLGMSTGHNKHGRNLVAWEPGRGPREGVRGKEKSTVLKQVYVCENNA